jgi:cytoskeletal protein RodZ
MLIVNDMKNNIQHKRLSHRAKIIVLIVAFLVVFGAAYLILANTVFKTAGDTSSTTKTDTENSVTPNLTDPTVYDDATQIVSEKGYAESQVWFDDKIENAPDKNTESNLYADRSIIATNNNEPQKAAEYALLAEQASPSALTAALVANTAYAMNDREVALKYYKLTLERTESWIGNSDVFQEYTKRIEELSQ